jgi:hypothetical protein
LPVSRSQRQCCQILDDEDRGLSLPFHFAYRHFARRQAFLLIKVACFLAVILVFPLLAGAQVNGNRSTVNLNATLTTSLTVTASPANVNFALVRNGVANGSATVSITTRWTLTQLIGTVQLWAYFSAPTAALSDGFGDNIPSSSVSGSPNGGAFTPFTATSPFAAGSSMRVFNALIFIFNTNAARTDTLDLRIDTTGLNLPAGTYTGVMHLQAQAL